MKLANNAIRTMTKAWKMVRVFASNALNGEANKTKEDFENESITNLQKN